MSKKSDLLEGINPSMRLTKRFFLEVFGFAYSDPLFAEEAIERLEEAGCSRARTYYEEAVAEWRKGYDALLYRVSIWYRQKAEKEWRAEADRWQKEVDRMCEAELKAALKRLLRV